MATTFQVRALKVVPCGDTTVKVGQVLGTITLEDGVPIEWVPRALCDHIAEAVNAAPVPHPAPAVPHKP